MREEACPRCFLHARSVSGTNQVLLDLGYSNLASGACAGRFLAGIQPLEMVGEFLNGRRFVVHLTVSLPARGFVSGHSKRHIPVADAVSRGLPLTTCRSDVIHQSWLDPREGP